MDHSLHKLLSIMNIEKMDIHYWINVYRNEYLKKRCKNFH